jgi:hypothetical protein
MAIPARLRRIEFDTRASSLRLERSTTLGGSTWAILQSLSRSSGLAQRPGRRTVSSGRKDASPQCKREEQRRTNSLALAGKTIVDLVPPSAVLSHQSMRMRTPLNIAPARSSANGVALGRPCCPIACHALAKPRDLRPKFNNKNLLTNDKCSDNLKKEINATNTMSV